MRALVTGAAGFLGSHVVRELLTRGHSVRAIVRPTRSTLPDWDDRVEVVRADLEVSRASEGLFDGVDVLIHLAATMRGTAEEQRVGTVVATERLLEATRVAGSTSHVVLAGSCSVYDWTATHGTLNEQSPLETNLDQRDGYTVAKVLQERITRRFADENRWTLSVLRPGFICGPGAGPAAGAGLQVGPFFLVVSPFARLRLTHVENCASAFVNAAEKRVEGTFNIVDDDQISAWRYAGRLIGGKSGVVRVPVPYYAGLAMAHLATIASRILLPAGRRKLPGILQPRQYRARFKPLQYDNRRAKEELDWRCRSMFDADCDVI